MKNYNLVTTRHRNVCFRISCTWIACQGEAVNLLLNENLTTLAMDKDAVKVVLGNETVGHLPRDFSRIAWYFLARSGEISVEVISRRPHCKQLCGGMEIPCKLEFKSECPLRPSE